jgi:uncharacterized paraquat-inducible protein A
MNTRNIIALLLIIISLGCLYPGLVKPVMSIKISAEIPLLGEMVLQETTQSVVSTIESLYEAKNNLVASLILLFSIIVPIIKAAILLAVLLIPKLPIKSSLQKFVAIISKWSMADVFVVGVLLAFLATKSESTIQAGIHEGFYFFLAYCIISILASQIIDVKSILNRES